MTATGRLTVDGADITSKSNTVYAQERSQLTIKSGTLKADQPSDGVVVTHSTDFIMEGGTITTDMDHFGVCFAQNGNGGGDNAGDGGGTISGGTIKAGVGIRIDGDRVTLSGAPDIDARIDIYFNTPTSSLLQAGNDLTGRFSVKYNCFEITEDSPYTFTAPADADQSGHFTSADTTLSIRDVAGDDDKHTVQLYKPAQQSHTHTWATAWSKDADGHWHACTAQGCDITDYAACGEAGAAYAAHIYDNDQDTTCNTCGYTRTVTKTDQAAPTGLFTVTDVPVGGTTGSITVTGDADKLEWRRVTDPATETWTAVAVSGSTATLGGLEAGSYEFRYKETATHNVSPATTVQVRALTAQAKALTIAGGIEHGTVTKRRDRVNPGDTVTLAVQPDEGYELETITVRYTEGGVDKTITPTVKPDNAAQYTFTMPDADVTVTATFSVVTPPEPQPGESKGEVEVKPGTPAVTVDEEVLKELAGEVREDESVTVKLTVEKQDAPAGKAELEGILQGNKDDVLYLDLSLLKTTAQGDGASVTETVTDTGETALEITVPYDFTRKKDVTAYRKHGENAAEALTALSARPTENFADGSFFADRVGGVVYLYASKFSTYAIGYTAESSSIGGSVPSTFKPNLHQPEHGTLTVSPAAASKGKTVTITPKPEEGYEVDTITVTDKNGKSLEVTKNANGTYTFTQPSGRANITATMKAATAAGDNTATAEFIDVKDTAWYHDDVYYCVEKGLMKGTGEDTFAPEITTSRAMIATILWRLAGEPGAKAATAYPDCAADSWYAPAVAWGTETGVVKGYGSGSFGPEDPITREQLALMLCRYAKAQGMDVSAGGDTNILSYKDFGEAGEWAVEALQWAAGAGIVNGKPGGLLDPKGEVTRAEAAAMLRRFCQLKK